MAAVILDTVLGVELRFLPEDRIDCRFVLVSHQKDQVDSNKEHQFRGNWVEVLQALPKQYPIALNITGKGLLNKNLPSLVGDDVEVLFHQAFPAVKQDDFYVQYGFGSTQALVSVMRKQMVDELLDKLSRAGLVVYSISFGAMVSSAIWPQLNSYGRELQFDGHFFKLNEQREFLSYGNSEVYQSEFPVKIGDTPINQQLILAYAAGFQLLFHEHLLPVRADVYSVNAAFDKFIANSHLIKKAKYFLFFLFTALLGSFLLFAHYSEKNADLLASLGARTAGVDQEALLQKKVLENEALLARLNWNGGYNLGFLLSELGDSLPLELILTEVSVNEANSDQQILENTPLIKVSGIGTDPIRVNNWIFELKKKPWVKTITLLKFQQDNSQSQNQFTLNITY